jgi:hypothetical protein
VLHVNNRPALSLGFIEPLIKPPNVRLAIVDPFPLTVGMMHAETESSARTSTGPLEHRQVPVRIVARGDWLTPDEFARWSVASLMVTVAQVRSAQLLMKMP